jgi:hypothetical protein
MASGGVVGFLRINMYLICVGPYHLNFEIPMGTPSPPRISFDFMVSQVVHMRIDTLETQIYNMKEVLGEEYAFSLKTLVTMLDEYSSGIAPKSLISQPCTRSVMKHRRVYR